LHQAIAIAHHGKGFSGPSLAVDKDTAIVALESVANELFAYRIEDIFLC